MHDDFASIRVDYAGDGFNADDAGSDPMALFLAWYGAARASDLVLEPNAVALATAASDGTPSVRMVLLKGVEEATASFTWFTNLDSRKAREIGGSGHAALCWWWPGTPGRQVRAVGRVHDLARDDSRAYFERRPIEAQVGAAASVQSRAIAGRADLEQRAAALDPAAVELPERWGGLRLVADELEFWQGRAGRLHDRITFLRLAADGSICSAPAIDAAGGDEQLRAAGTVVRDPHGTSWLRARLQP